MAAPWARVVNSTTRNYIKEREDNVLRNRKATALLKKRGRITYGWAGTEMEWPVKYKRVRLTPFADGDTLDFARKERNKKAHLGWRGYSGTDSMTKGEFLMNRGKSAILNIYSTIASDLMDDMEEDFGEELYINGGTAANSRRIHGIESFMAATPSAGNGAATPTATFAGLDCTPGAYGGTWNSGALPGWPNGRGDAHYDFWSPIVVDYGDSLFPGVSASHTNTWAYNCEEAVSFGIIKSKKSKSKKGQLDLILLDDEMYRTYIAQMRAKQRIVVNNSKSDLYQLGFTDMMNQDGTDITWEYGMPPGVGYGLNIDNMELRSMQSQLFVAEGPEQDIATKSWRFSVDMFGNLVWNPKFQVKFYQGTAVG